MGNIPYLYDYDNYNSMEWSVFGKRAGIYLITDPKGFQYIGATSNLKNRLRKHTTNSDRKLLASAFKYYGPDNMHITLLEVYDAKNTKYSKVQAYRDHMLNMETKYINEMATAFPAGYNLIQASVEARGLLNAIIKYISKEFSISEDESYDVLYKKLYLSEESNRYASGFMNIANRKKKMREKLCK